MRRTVLILALLATGCRWFGSDPGGDATQAPTAAASTEAATPTPTVPVAREVDEETDDYLFGYTYPLEAAEIPELAALLDKRLDESRKGLASGAAAARKQAADNGFPYNKHSVQTEWQVVADLPEWLSLSAQVNSYEGGAHGNYGFDALVWDKEKGQPHEAIDLFASAAALEKALGPKLCRALNAERAKRRGGPVPKNSTDEFDKCVPVSDATVQVGSAGRRKFDRIGVQFGPYVAGPYAEGAYELNFPVDGAVLAAVKPEFRDAFAARK